MRVENVMEVPADLEYLDLTGFVNIKGDKVTAIRRQPCLLEVINVLSQESTILDIPDLLQPFSFD